MSYGWPPATDTTCGAPREVARGCAYSRAVARSAPKNPDSRRQSLSCAAGTLTARSER